MITASLHRLGDALEQAMPVVVHGRGLTVHQPLVAHDLAAEMLDDALVAEADTENRDLAGECGDHRQRVTGILWSARSRRDDEMRRLDRPGLLERECVVPVHDHLGALFTERLDQVVSE